MAEHPTPWRWNPEPAGMTGTADMFTHQLLDAAGAPVLSAGSVSGSPHALAIVEAAGDMEPLLRAFADPERIPQTCHVTPPCSCDIHLARAVIAGIDERAKGGG